MTNIYKNRYQAIKDKNRNPYLTGDEVCVKVWGGYVLMSREEYKEWRSTK